MGAAAPQVVLMRVFHDKRYVLLAAIFAIDIGTGQTMAKQFRIRAVRQALDDGGGGCNLARPFGALCIGAVVATSIAQQAAARRHQPHGRGAVLFAQSAADASLKMTSFSWFPLPMEKIPSSSAAFRRARCSPSCPSSRWSPSGGSHRPHPPP